MNEEKHDENLEQKIIEAVSEQRPKKDYEAEVLADVARRAHDEELQALANIALIRSGFEHRNQRQAYSGDPRVPPTRQELEDRLRNILSDADYNRN